MHYILLCKNARLNSIENFPYSVYKFLTKKMIYTWPSIVIEFMTWHVSRSFAHGTLGKLQNPTNLSGSGVRKCKFFLRIQLEMPIRASEMRLDSANEIIFVLSWNRKWGGGQWCFDISINPYLSLRYQVQLTWSLRITPYPLDMYFNGTTRITNYPKGRSLRMIS